MGFIKSEIKNIIIFVAILGGLYFVYTYFFKEDISTNATSLVGVTSASGSVGGEILPLLLEVKRVKLDKSVFDFDDVVFQKLNNFSRELNLVEGDKHRNNPFAPFEDSVTPASPQINISVGSLTN